MHLLLVFLLSLISLYSSPLVAYASSSSSPNVLTQGTSLLVEKNDHLVSPNGLFTAGFHKIGQNAYFFAIWFSEPLFDGSYTIVWMANRDAPVNRKRSRFSLSKTGDLVLTDAGVSVWKTDTQSSSSRSPLQLQLLDSGNLVLTQLEKKSCVWQSFSFPTDTILPNQPFTKDTVLISSRSSTNLSSGFYKLYFDNDNVIRLLYNNNQVTSVYWPSPWLISWEAKRSTYNNSRFAMLDSKGRFQSSDDLYFTTIDYGDDALQRRLTLDVDGNIRVYSLKERRWSVSWQAISITCTIHGICGPNSLCTSNPKSGRRSCTCMHGYKRTNHSDWSLGCEPTYDLSGHHENYGFIKLPYVEFYGFDTIYMPSSTLKQCKKACLDNSNCKAFQHTFNRKDGIFNCYVKTLLFNGHSMDTSINTYLKLPKTDVSTYNKYVVNEYNMNCSSSIIHLERTYEKRSENGSLKFMLWFAIILGVIEVTSIVFFYYITKQPLGTTTRAYHTAATGFKRFTYDEIVKASHKFSEEIGRGGGGIVYKGILPDNRVVAIKRLHEAIQGEAEFLAEMNIIGRINHRNLVETYGYCAEGKHRILVYEYMENGSLARNLDGNHLDWQNVFEIANGVAKGLAYLHEECLEWVLHCDIKPHNILLGDNYNPKVADFGLSKLFYHGVIQNSNFSRIRGTRGYMAPEWVFNLPITSKVDVYSYGMVVLEMLTGRSPKYDQLNHDNERSEQKRLVSWVREKIHAASESLTETQIMEIINPMIKGEYDKHQMYNLVKVALQCVEEDREARPTMSEVVKMLMHPEMDN